VWKNRIPEGELNGIAVSGTCKRKYDRGRLIPESPSQKSFIAMPKKLLVATTLVTLPFVANAADLVTKAPVMKAPPVSASRINWTGCFGGLNAGWGWGNYKQINDAEGSGGVASVDASGPVFGGQLGCNYQTGSLVFGIEGSLGGANIKGDDALNVPKTETLGSITARLGFANALGNEWMPYVKGGYAYRRERDNWNDGHLTSFHQDGWTVGGGLEYMVARQLSLFVDYSYYKFGNHTDLTTGGGCCDFSAITNASISVVKVGANFRFWQ
jgi:outer membrane immunogenic protein